MSDHKQEPTTISQQPDAENKKKSTELSEEALKKATGGTGDVTIDMRKAGSSNQGTSGTIFIGRG